MKITLLSFVMSLISVISFSQNYISFEYDDAGNRTDRLISIASTKSAYVADVETEVFSETLEELNFKMYPNPTKGELTVEIENLTGETNASISIYDLQGRQIYNNSNASATNAIDLSNHSPGTYIMILKVANKTREWKIVKE